MSMMYLFGVCGVLVGQINPLTVGRELGGAPGSSNQSGTQEDFIPETDTFGVFSFYAQRSNEQLPAVDTTLSGFFHQYDPARRQNVDWLNLGFLGSPAHPVDYRAPDRMGFDVGLHQFDLYFDYADEVPFYLLENPFSDLSFYQLGNQADIYFKGVFSRNFANGVNFSLNHERISVIGSENQYPNQRTLLNILSAGLWINPPGGKYESFFTFATNKVRQENNGGVAVEPASTNTSAGIINSPSSAEVFLDDAQTDHVHNEFLYTHFLKFGGGVDSIKGQRRSFTIGHEVGFHDSEYRYFDPFVSSGSLPTSSDSAYYNNFLVDRRGLRFYAGHRRISNSIRINTFKKRGGAGKGPSDYLELGLKHQIHWLDLEASDSTINNLFLTGALDFNPNDRLKIKTYGHLGIWDNAGDYKLSGNLILNFGKLGILKGEFVNQLNRPTLMAHKLIIAQRTVWDNNFSATLNTTIGGTYENPAWKFGVTGRYHLINNAIYYDEGGVANQTKTPISVFQLIVEKNFQLGRIHLDNVVVLQQSSENFIRVPDFYGKHSLYYHGKWFGVLNVRLGADLRLNNPYEAYGYRPLVGQFVIQENESVDWYPVVDAFFGMRVARFRAFAKWENLVNLANLDRLYYQTINYPHWWNGLRIGINWQFLN